MPGRTFTGVPVFQAQGLTVKTENSRYTPLFLAKEDLDVAVGAAFSQREAAKEVANKSKAGAAEEEVASAQAAVRSTCCAMRINAGFVSEPSCQRTADWGKARTVGDPWVQQPTLWFPAICTSKDGKL